MESPQPSQRFQQRAADYAGSRPTYPASLVDQLLRRLSLRAQDRVADIGSGTGIFTQILLERGLHVTAVEPNADMRRVAELQLGGQPGFSSVAGSAGATGLAAASVAAIFCAQAFHWFNETPTLREWQRILQPGGSAVLVWNYQDETDPFIADYLKVVRACGAEADKTLSASWHAHLDNVLFQPGAAEKIEVAHVQRLDFAGLLRRSSSTSYLPKSGDPAFADLAQRLQTVFARHQVAGQVAFAYRTIAVFGPLPPGPA